MPRTRRRPAARPAPNARPATTPTTRGQILALVDAEPELSTREIAARLGLASHSHVHRVLVAEGYRPVQMWRRRK